MHHVSSRAAAAMTIIVVDGDLDAVSAYDLQHTLETAIGHGVRRVGLDLSRVSSADDTGIHGLIRCCDAAVAARMQLSMIGCSRPAVLALRGFHARRSHHRKRSDETTAVPLSGGPAEPL